MVIIEMAKLKLAPLQVIDLLKQTAIAPIHDVGNKSGIGIIQFLRGLGLVHEIVINDEIYYAATLAGHCAVRAWTGIDTNRSQACEGDETRAELISQQQENERISRLLDAAAAVVIEIARTGDSGLAQKHIDAYERSVLRNPAS